MPETPYRHPVAHKGRYPDLEASSEYEKGRRDERIDRRISLGIKLFVVVVLGSPVLGSHLQDKDRERAKIIKGVPTAESPLHWSRDREPNSDGISRCQGVVWAEFPAGLYKPCVCKHIESGNCEGLEAWISTLCECDTL